MYGYFRNFQQESSSYSIKAILLKAYKICLEIYVLLSTTDVIMTSSKIPLSEESSI